MENVYANEPYRPQSIRTPREYVSVRGVGARAHSYYIFRLRLPSGLAVFATDPSIDLPTSFDKYTPGHSLIVNGLGRCVCAHMQE